MQFHKNKNRTRKVNFESITDILYVFLKFQFIYCLLLFLQYVSYQNGRGQFRPVLSMALFPVMLIISHISRKMKNTILGLCISIAIGSVFVFLLPFQGDRIWFLGALLAIIASSFIKINANGDKEAKMYALRYREVNRQYYWGGGMIFVFLLHLAVNAKSEEVYLVSPQVCQNYMMLSFGLYIVATILLGYAFRFMNYYRQCASIDIRSERQIRRSMYIVTVLLVIVVSIVILFGTAPIIKITNVIIIKVLYIVFSILLFLNSKIGSLYQLKSTSSGGSVKAPSLDLDKTQNVNGGNDALLPILLVMVIVVVIGYSLWKLYKKMLANYKLENDTAEYIPVHDEGTQIQEPKNALHKMIWGNSNNEKIRKYYFKIMKRRFLSDKNDTLKSCTPKELIVTGRSEKENEGLSKLTEYYEKARYSNEECSIDEVIKSKDAMESIEK